MAESVPSSSTPVARGAEAPRASAATAPRVGSLYVTNLAPTVTESILFEFFRGIGENTIASIRVCRDNQHPERRSLGYAYVNFHNEKDADRAIDTLNFEPIEGKPCRISWSKRDPSLRKSGVGNLFIKNLDKEIDDVGLYDTFSKFGVILSSKIALDRITNDSKGYGFVHFENVADSEKAISALNGKCLNGKQVYVGPFIPKHKRPNRDANNFTNIYVKHIHEDVTPEKFIEHFNNISKDIGEITSPKLMTESVEKDGKVVEQSKKFGFINFKDHESAAKVLEILKDQAKVDELAPGLTAEGMELYSAVAVPKSKRNNPFDQKPQNLNLYVKNISEEVTEEQLREAFARFGTITSLKIMEDEKGIKKGFGFVCYDSPDAARDAMTNMHSSPLAGKPLYVALAQRKEIRRQQLQQQLAARAVPIPSMVPYGFFPPGPPRRMQGSRPGGNFRGMPRPYPVPGQFPRQMMVPMHPPMLRNGNITPEYLEEIPEGERIQRIGDLIYSKLLNIEQEKDASCRQIVTSLIKKAKGMSNSEAVEFLIPYVNDDAARQQAVASVKNLQQGN